MELLTKNNYVAFLEYCFYTISQECYSATWMDGIEYELWDLVQKYDTRKDWKFEYGQCVVGGALLKILKALSSEIDGWIVWDDKKVHSTYIKLSEWIPLYKKWKGED